MNYFTIGGTFPFTLEGYNPFLDNRPGGMMSRAVSEYIDISQFSFSFSTVLRVGNINNIINDDGDNDDDEIDGKGCWFVG